MFTLTKDNDLSKVDKYTIVCNLINTLKEN